MAQEALKKLDDQLNCSICLHTYTDPRELQCFHVYCGKCLIKLVVRDQQGLLLTCPICRQVTPVPGNGVAGLQSAFNIIPFLEIQDSFKKLKDSSVTLEGAVGGGGVTDLNPKKVNKCFEHEDKELELYCETCGKLICYHCALKGGKHRNHDYELLSKVFEKYKEEITPSLETMEKQLTIINKALTHLDARCGEISDQRTPIEAKLHDTFRRLHETLNVRETKLIEQLHQIIQGKLKGLAAQRNQIETIQVQLSSCLDFIKEKFKTNSHGQVVMMKTTIEKQVKELTATFHPDMYNPNTEADIMYSASADMTALCQKYGQVSTPGSPDPSKCHTSIEGVKLTAEGEKSTAMLQVINFKGQPCVEPIESLECELMSDLTGTRIRCSIERIGESQYEISYQPTVKGRHQLHIKIQDHHIRGSPFCVVAKSAVEKLGIPICTIDVVGRPYGVAFSQKGEVVITEYDRHCVSVFSPSGEKLWQFGTQGSGHGQFNYPHGVAVDGDGNLLVVDNNEHLIQKFTADGHFLAAVGIKGEGPLQFNYPSGIAFNSTNNQMYVGSGNDHIQVLNSDLTLSSMFGGRGTDKGQLRGTLCLAFDSTGKVYVSDSGNHRIQVFTAEGKFLRMFGRCGKDKGGIVGPAGIAIDTNGLVYVSEHNNHRVSVFTSEGQFVTSFGRKGEGPGQFDHPRGLALGDYGVVYVCDGNNRRVQVF